MNNYINTENNDKHEDLQIAKEEIKNALGNFSQSLSTEEQYELDDKINMTAEEKFDVILNLKEKLEDDFVTLGQLLSELKRTQLFKRKGYKSFKEFIEGEFNFSNSFASKLMGIYNLYIHEMDVDERSVKEIGVDKLSMIKPVVKDCSIEEAEQWVQKAKQLNPSELREEVKIVRDKKKEMEKSLKDVFIGQFYERFLAHFNCNKKELGFKLALFFQDADLEEVSKIIKTNQSKYELENPQNLI